MQKALAYLTLGSTFYMIMGSVMMVSLFGFDLDNDTSEPAVRFFLEPAGYAFSIWSFIYVGYIALGIYQAQTAQIEEERFVRARVYMILNAVANSIWFLGFAQNQIWLTLICMVTMLITLIRLAVLLELGKPGKDLKEKLMVKLPLALYFGWITLATPINTTSFLLVEMNWTGQSFLGPEVWSILIMLVAFIIIILLFQNRLVNPVYLLVGVWGLFAIFIANMAFSIPIAVVAIGLCLGLLLVLWRSYRQQASPFFLV